MSDEKARSPSPFGGSPSQNGDEHDSEGVSAKFITFLRNGFKRRQNGSARAEIEDALAADEAAGEAFTPEERNMLRAILRLGDLRVDDVMVPRADINAVAVDTSVLEALVEFRSAGHSRLPVYRDNLDDPIGMVHVKDAMAWMLDTAEEGTALESLAQSDDAGDEKALRVNLACVDLSLSLEETKIVRPILFVPPSMPARILLERMQASRIQIALVIDEYGGTDGLVSLEDLVEIIVGEIEDEHDDEDDDFYLERTDDGQIIVDARAPIEVVIKEVGSTFSPNYDEDDVDTIGGLIFTLIGRVPVRGEIVRAVEGFEFEILDADPRRLKRIRIRERRKMAASHRSRTRAAGAKNTDTTREETDQSGFTEGSVGKKTVADT